MFNVEKFVTECVQSIVNQTFKNWKLIIVNDCSTDDSLAIVQKVAENDDRISIISLPKNCGQSVARNVGLQHADGEFVAFVDADDFLAPDFLERHFSQIDDNDFIQSNFARVNADGEVLKIFKNRHKYRFISPCFRLYRREFLEKTGMKFVENMIFEDVIFSVDLWTKSPKIKLIDYCGYFYRQNPNSTTSQNRDTTEVFRQLRARQKSAPWQKKWIVAFTFFKLKLHFLKKRLK